MTTMIQCTSVCQIMMSTAWSVDSVADSDRPLRFPVHCLCRENIDANYPAYCSGELASQASLSLPAIS